MKIVNRKFNRDFEEVESFEAGIVLTGAEVKSTKQGGIRLEDSYVKILEDGPYLINAEIYKYKYDGSDDYDSRRSRKLLLNKDEIMRIRTKLSSSRGLTLVPILCYNKGSRVKLKIALVRGRRDVEKRKLEKAKTIKRSIDRELKEYVKS